MTYPLPVEAIDKLITTAITYRDRAYCPYSKFRVGAALYAEDGTIFGGCNVENASYGAGICAERTAITKAISEGHSKYLAVAVVSDIPSPSISPCGICRQFLREFLSPKIPIYMISSHYPSSSSSPPTFLSELGSDEADKYVKVMTMEEILPCGFGPDHLHLAERS